MNSRSYENVDLLEALLLAVKISNLKLELIIEWLLWCPKV